MTLIKELLPLVNFNLFMDSIKDTTKNDELDNFDNLKVDNQINGNIDSILDQNIDRQILFDSLIIKIQIQKICLKMTL